MARSGIGAGDDVPDEGVEIGEHRDRRHTQHANALPTPPIIPLGVMSGL